jgi:uncharacterized peroxidase-related enzyme
MKPMRDFTNGEFTWQPWLPPVDMATATEPQRAALSTTPSNRPVDAYSLVLAHDPESVAQRSPLYNAIMFGPRGLPRAERELGAVVASRINGCPYCAAVHAKRFTDLTKEPEVMQALHTAGIEAELSPRRRAIVDFSAKLTSDPSAVSYEDVKPLRDQGLDDQEIIDLIHAVAMFGWANRLMQTLGEAV